MDLTKAPLSDMWLASDRSLLAVATCGLAKVLRVQIRSGPPMSSRPPDEIEFSSMPEHVVAQFAEPLAFLRAAKFDVATVTHSQAISGDEFYGLLLLSLDCLTICALNWTSMKGPAEKVAVLMLSRRREGTMLLSSNLPFGFKSPSWMKPEHISGASIAQVLARHQQRIAHELDIIPNHRSQLRDIMEDHRQRIEEFHVQRGFYVIATDAEIAQARQAKRSSEAADAKSR